MREWVEDWISALMKSTSKHQHGHLRAPKRMVGASDTWHSQSDCPIHPPCVLLTDEPGLSNILQIANDAFGADTCHLVAKMTSVCMYACAPVCASICFFAIHSHPLCSGVIATPTFLMTNRRRIASWLKGNYWMQYITESAVFMTYYIMPEMEFALSRSSSQVSKTPFYSICSDARRNLRIRCLHAQKCNSQSSS